MFFTIPHKCDLPGCHRRAKEVVIINGQHAEWMCRTHAKAVKEKLRDKQAAAAELPDDLEAVLAEQCSEFTGDGSKQLVQALEETGQFVPGSVKVEPTDAT